MTFLSGDSAGMTSLCWRPVTETGHVLTRWRVPVPRPIIKHRNKRQNKT